MFLRPSATCTGRDRAPQTIARVVRSRASRGIEGAQLHVAELDAVDVMSEFLPREAVRQSEWSRELMRDYSLVRGTS